MYYTITQHTSINQCIIKYSLQIILLLLVLHFLGNFIILAG